MDWKHLLFSFEGRINRAKYWLVALINVSAMVVAALIALYGLPGGIVIIAFVLALVLIYVGVAAGVKRLHDRDKSGWWLILFYLVPSGLQGLADDSFVGSSLLLNLAALAISIWAIVELGCLRGTEGPNQYGPDPLKGRRA